MVELVPCGWTLLNKTGLGRLPDGKCRVHFRLRDSPVAVRRLSLETDERPDSWEMESQELGR